MLPDTDCIRSTTLLLLPGTLCDERLFAPQRRHFEGQLPLVIPSFQEGTSIADFARAALQAADGRLSVVGLSMGGIVALEMWRQAAGRIDRIALLDTNYCAEEPERRALRQPQIDVVRDRGLAPVLRDELLPLYFAAASTDNAALQQTVMQMGIEQGAAVFERQSIALRDRPDSTQTLPGISCPALVLCGEEDRLCPPDLHRDMARRLPQAELEIIPSCGHLSTLEAPDAVNAALTRWLSRDTIDLPRDTIDERGENTA